MKSFLPEPDESDISRQIEEHEEKLQELAEFNSLCSTSPDEPENTEDLEEVLKWSTEWESDLLRFIATEYLWGCPAHIIREEYLKWRSCRNMTEPLGS